MTDYELLSKMLSGDLTRAERRKLEARMKEDAQLASAWEAMRTIPRALAELPDPTPPRHLDEAVLSSARRPRPWLLLPWALAAAALLAVLAWPRRDPPSAVLLEGRQVVEGHVTVLAGDLPVEVRGRAEISVEPPAGALRESDQEVSEMTIHTLAAALTGAAVTVAVYEGSALINPGAEDAVALAAGETHTTAPPAAPQQRAVVTRAAPEDLSGASREELEARVSALEEELAAARFEQQVASGRLTAHEGEPQEWPEGLPEAFTAGPYEQALAEAFEGAEGMELVEVDCSEFPCLAIVESFSNGDDWPRAISDRARGVPEQLGYDEPVSQSVMASSFETDEGFGNYVGLVMLPDGYQSEEAQTRASFRLEAAIQDLVQE